VLAHRLLLNISQGIDMAFKVGDQVQLKSGGPVMTVRHTASYSTGVLVDCQWFSGAKLNDGRFAVDSLMPASKAPKKD
jgi:uncharacterized protein YodC (DUF2158 family)